MQETIKCRTAPSLGGGFAGTPESVWGTPPYNPETDLDTPTVFFGMYGFPDFFALWRHRAKRYILWAGTDIQHLKNGYWLEDSSYGLKLDPLVIGEWINKYCENWCENEVEQGVLFEVGIKAKVCPSFLGDVNAYDVSYTHSTTPKVYASVSGDNFEMYGWPAIEVLVTQHPEIEFHLYGNKNPYPTKVPNVVVHGRVTQEQMESEVKHMQGGLRLLKHDGFSEILAKSILWGQWPISRIPYPHMLSVEELGTLKNQDTANMLGRSYYQHKVNKFPWNQK